MLCPRQSKPKMTATNSLVCSLILGGWSMLRRSAIFLAVSLTLLSSGCSQQIAAYAPDPQSTNLLRGGSARLKLVLKPAAFSDDGSFICRLIGTISLPDGQSFGQYVMDALHQDLKASELTDQTTGRELTLHLNRVDFSSALGATNWFLDVEYGSMDEKFVVSTVYNDRSSYVGAKACGNIALYFRKAVAEHLRQLYSHPTFRRMTGIPALVSGTSSGDAGNVAARLLQLDKFHKDGLITKEEYEVRR